VVEEGLFELAEAVVRGENGRPYYEKYREAVSRVTPEQVIAIVDELYRKKYPVDQMKTGINKFLNLFFESLKNQPEPKPAAGTFLHFLMLSNSEMEARLDKLRPDIKKINGKEPLYNEGLPEIMERIKDGLTDLTRFNNHYLIKENILFPAIEKAWPDYRCVQVMWAFHDDIRRDIRSTIGEIEKETPDMPALNRLFGSIFFNMLAIKFREERILFPVMLETFPKRVLDEMLHEAKEIGFSYINTLTMSELINNSEIRKQTLKGLLLKIHEGVDPDRVKADLVELLREVPYGEVVEVEQELIEEGLPAEEIQKFCDVHSLVLDGNIDLSGAKSIPQGHPVDTFIQENKELIRLADSASEKIDRIGRYKSAGEIKPLVLELLADFNLLLDVDKHYQRKEYLLFPFLEKAGITGPPKVMWGKHDEIRDLLKGCIEVLRTPDLSPEDLSSTLKLLFYPALDGVEDMVKKEEEILFPMSMDHLTDENWWDIYQQTLAIGFCLYDPQVEWKPEGIEGISADETAIHGNSIQLPSGSFTSEEIMAILNTLPVDITFVDRNDKVKYFSQGPHRIFTRSRSIINRDVRLCHPPASVHIVEKILEDFKSGKASHAPFWIQMKGRFIYIEYYALRGESGEYLGTLEVSQDLTDYRKLEGEQRILSYTSEK